MRHLVFLLPIFLIACLDSHPPGEDPEGLGAFQNPGAALSPDQPARCFEIFPEGPGALTGFDNPTRFDLGSMAAGETADFSVGYYNFCATEHHRVLRSGWIEDDAESLGFTAVSVPESVNEDAYQSAVQLSFTAVELGRIERTFRLYFGHGYYDIQVEVEVLPSLIDPRIGLFDGPGDCFEIFPEHSGDPEDPDAPMFHTNPTTFNLHTLEVGETRNIAVRYYNFCATPDPTVYDSRWLEDDAETVGFSLVRVPDAINEDVGASTVELSFTATVPGTFTRTFRFALAHGYYDIVTQVEVLAAE